MHKAAVQQGLVAEQAPFVCVTAWISERTMRQRSQNCSETACREEYSRRQPRESCFYIQGTVPVGERQTQNLLRCLVEAEDARELPMIFSHCDDKALDVISPAGRPRAGGDKAPSLTGVRFQSGGNAGTFPGGGGMQNEAHDHAGVRGAHLPDAVPL